MNRRSLLALAGTIALLAPANEAAAQYPQQYPPQPYPQQYPPQQYPPQQYPPQYPPQQYPPQQYPQYPPPQQGRNARRGDGELAFLLGTSAAYGVGTGIAIDFMANVKDPGLAVIAPIGLGLAVPGALFAVDFYQPFHSGVPASISTGLLLGAVEGIAISGTQWQLSSKDKQWGVGGYGALTFVMSTAGGVGGYFFGEFLGTNPRSLAFVASGAGWGALTGAAFGFGIGSGDLPKAADPAAVSGLIFYNVGLAGTGALSLFWTPSWRTQKYMWAGYGLGTLAGCVVYPFYLASDTGDPRHGLIANALGGVAGLVLAGALTYNLRDPGDTSAKGWKPPFQVAVAPAPGGGAALSAFGEW